MPSTQRSLEEEEEIHHVLTRGVLRAFQFAFLHRGDVLTHYIGLTVYLGQLQGRPFDLSSLASFTMLPRSTVSRKLAELRPHIVLKGHHRKIATFEPKTPEQQHLTREYFLGLEKIFIETCQELAAARTRPQ